MSYCNLLKGKETLSLKTEKNTIIKQWSFSIMQKKLWKILLYIRFWLSETQRKQWNLFMCILFIYLILNWRIQIIIQFIIQADPFVKFV
jgi:hypothetical protein